MRVVTVVPIKKGMIGDGLSYFTAEKVKEGSIVEITIRLKKTIGIVIQVKDAKDVKGEIKDLSFNLKKIENIKEVSIWRKEYIDSVFDASNYFASKKSDALNGLIPTQFKKEYNKITNILQGAKSFEQTDPKTNIKTEKLLFQSPIEDRISLYKTLIRESFANKQSIFIVLPNDTEAEKYSAIFSKGIDQFTFTMHNSLSPQKTLEKYRQIMHQDHPVLIIGTTQYLAINRTDIKTIVVEKENSSGYKMIARPFFDYRIFAEIFASKIGAKFILADSLLRFENIGRKTMSHFGELRNLSFRIPFEGNIEIKERGNKTDVLDKQFKIFDEGTIETIKETLTKNKKVFIFALRKGLATMTICRDCGETLMCDKCQAPVVLFKSKNGKKRMFFCNRCKKEKNPNTFCPRCKSWDLVPLGIGTDTVYEELRQIFPNKKDNIFKLDKESAKTSAGALSIIKSFNNSKSAILIGTEMVFHYLEEKIPLSVVASFDSLFSIPNFKINEKVIRILTSIISITEKKIIIETKNPRDEAIKSVLNENLVSFIREEIKDREALGYPPFMRFIKVIHTGTQEETNNVKNFIKKEFEEYKPFIYHGFVSKIRDKYITNVLIKIPIENWSLPELISNATINKTLLQKLVKLPPSFRVMIDPEDLL